MSNYFVYHLMHSTVSYLFGESVNGTYGTSEYLLFQILFNGILNVKIFIIILKPLNYPGVNFSTFLMFTCIWSIIFLAFYNFNTCLQAAILYEHLEN